MVGNILRPLAALLLALTGRAYATDIRWLSPERGLIKGGNTVYVKGVDFKHTGLGPLTCRFHEKEVPAKVVSTTLLQCVAPGAPRPADVSVVVLEDGSRQLSGAELVYQYYECDSRECFIGDYVPSDLPLLAPGEEPPSVVEDSASQEAEQLVEIEDEVEGVADKEEDMGGREVSAWAMPAGDAGVNPEWVEAEVPNVVPPIAAGMAHTPEEQRAPRVPAYMSEQALEAPEEQMAAVESVKEGAGEGDVSASVAAQESESEEAEAVMEDEMVWLAGCVAALLLGLGGVYAVLLQTLGLAGNPVGSFLPEVGVKGDGSQGYQGVKSNTEDTMIETEGSSATTSSNMALERSASSRPNHSGVRKQADLKRYSAYDGEDEAVPLSHLCWLLGSDGPALQKLQSILADVTAGRIKHTEIVHKLQGLDAQRLLHSESVCAKALVHAGLSVLQAEKVSAEIYRNGVGRDTEPDAPCSPTATPARPVMPMSPASSNLGSPQVASPRQLSRSSSVEYSFGGASSTSLSSSSIVRDHSGLLDTSLEDALLRSFTPSPSPQRRGGIPQDESPSLIQPSGVPFSEHTLSRLNTSGQPAAPDKAAHSASFSPGPITCPPPSATSRSSSGFSHMSTPISDSASPLRKNSGTRPPPSTLMAEVATTTTKTAPLSKGSLAARNSPVGYKAISSIAKSPVSSPPRPPTTGVPSATFSPMRAPPNTQRAGAALDMKTLRINKLVVTARMGDSPTSPSAFPAGTSEEDDWN